MADNSVALSESDSIALSRCRRNGWRFEKVSVPSFDGVLRGETTRRVTLYDPTPANSPSATASATAPTPSAALVDRPDLQITAYHEAGHVVGAFALSVPVVRAEVFADGRGITSYDETAAFRLSAVQRATLAFCGPMGEAFVTGEPPAFRDGARGDHATVAALGLTPADEYRAREAARAIISANFYAVRDLAGELQSCAVLGEAELQRLVWSRVRPHRVH